MIEVIDTYATRSQVARVARRQGIEHFYSIRMPNGWRLVKQDRPSPDFAEALAYAKSVDFVHHVEVQFIDEGKTPGTRSVLIATCLKDELPQSIPFAVDPITPSLWAEGAADNFEHRARSSSSAGERAKSEVESPTKLVWKIADEMVGASKKEVVAACVAAGVNPSTASTQHYRWSKAKESA